MSIIFVNQLTGTLAGDGSEDHPKKSIAQAELIAVDGDTICLAPGAYREAISLPPITSGVHGEFRYYGMGVVVIDAESIRDCIAPQLISGVRHYNILFENIIFRNALIACINIPAVRRSGFTQSQVECYLAFRNCTGYQDSIASDVPFILANKPEANDDGSGFGHATGCGIAVALMHCTLKRFSTCVLSKSVRANQAISPGTSITTIHNKVTLSIRDSIIDMNSSAANQYMIAPTPEDFNTSGATINPILPVEGTSVSATVTGDGLTNAKYAEIDMRACSKVAAQGATGSYRTVNIVTTAPPYRTNTYPNPILALDRSGTNIASYLQTGTNLGNIGSEFFPVYGHDYLFTLLPVDILDVATERDALLEAFPNWTDPASGVEFVTDPNYVDGLTKGPSVRVDDANGDHAEVDTATQPSATSARWLAPWRKIDVRAGAPVTIKWAFRQAVEDTSGSAGAKKVVDSTLANSTRTMQYRTASVEPSSQTVASGGTVSAFSDINFTADGSEQHTQTFWLQEAFILTLAGQ